MTDSTGSGTAVPFEAGPPFVLLPPAVPSQEKHVSIGEILQEDPLFVPPDEYLGELRPRRDGQQSGLPG